jgi:hypothetical protein
MQSPEAAAPSEPMAPLSCSTVDATAPAPAIRSRGIVHRRRRGLRARVRRASTTHAAEVKRGPVRGRCPSPAPPD